MTATEIALGPVLFNWRPEQWRDFYFRIADEAPVGTVYLGEVVCSKRSPFFQDYYPEVIERLAGGGKAVVFSTLSQVVHKQDRKLVDSVCAESGLLVEVNDVSALQQLQGRPCYIGPYVNVYNEETLDFLASRGVRNVCLATEIPATVIRCLCEHGKRIGVGIEVQVFGRMSLALSARCYHARAHDRTKDSCQLVCDQDPDGLELRTLDNQPYLAINGIQTLSYDYLNLIYELPELRDMGVSRFRLSPQSCDMPAVASIFRAVLDLAISPQEGAARLDAMTLPAVFSNGFYYGKPGSLSVATAAASRSTQQR